MSDEDLLRFADKYRKAIETTSLALRLAEINTDILYTMMRFCERKNIDLNEGIFLLIQEAEGLVKKIEKINSSTKSYQPDKTPNNLPVYCYVHCPLD